MAPSVSSAWIVYWSGGEGAVGVGGDGVKVKVAVSATSVGVASPSVSSAAAPDGLGESATTDGGALPWYDGFESGDFIEGGWTVFSGDASVSGTSYTGEYGAKLIKTTWIEKAISTEGFTQIHVKYARKQNSGMDEGEYLFVEWWDGTDWNELERTQDTSWVYKDFTCSSGADDNPNFKLRFRTNCDKVPEVGFVDDVEITGTSL